MQKLRSVLTMLPLVFVKRKTSRFKNMLHADKILRDQNCAKTSLFCATSVQCVEQKTRQTLLVATLRSMFFQENVPSIQLLYCVSGESAF